ncbi:MAG TPA: hypothetical protein VGL26_03270 [Jatrophihabitans sp.]|jgi:hypothetical protein
MTSATLYREGDDLDSLLSALDAEFPGQVRVVEVSYPRTGGIGGFFAKQKVAVEYTLQADAAGSRPRPKPGRRPVPGPRPAGPFVEPRGLQFVEPRGLRFVEPRGFAPAAGPMDALLDEADSRDSVRSAVATGGGTSNAEFAQLLLELAAKKSATRAATVTKPWPQATSRNLDAQLRTQPKLPPTVELPREREVPDVDRTEAVISAGAIAGADVVPLAKISSVDTAAFEPIAAPVLAPVVETVLGTVVAPVVGTVVGTDPETAAETSVDVPPTTVSQDDVAEAAAAPHPVTVRRRKSPAGRTSTPKETTPKEMTPKRSSTRRAAKTPADPFDAALQLSESTDQLPSLEALLAADAAAAGAAATDSPSELRPQISVPDLSLRNLTSATAAVVAGNAVTSSQLAVLKQLRGKLADVVDLLDQLAEVEG